MTIGFGKNWIQKLFFGRLRYQFLAGSLWMKNLLVLFLLFIGGHHFAYGKNKSIGIIAALPQELEALKGELENVEEQDRGREKFWVGRLGRTAVVATLSGVGKVNASVAAQRLISEFGATAIIFTGVAGGISKSLNIGDIVVAKEVYQHDFGFLGKEFVRHAPGTLPEIGIGTGKEPVNLGLSWPTIGRKKRDFFDSTLELFRSIQEKFSPVIVNDLVYKPKIQSGVVATGDQFIASEEKKQELAKQGADVVEMEGGAVAQVADKNGIPFLVIRSVSDKAGTKAKFDFGKFVSSVAANNSLLVKELLTDDTFASYFQER